MKIFKIFVMHESMFNIHCVYIQKVLREVICLCHADDKLGPDNSFFSVHEVQSVWKVATRRNWKSNCIIHLFYKFMNCPQTIIF